ncbi:MAG TPA: Gfo/Idh/MocA family oxidoreductase [Ignavibacteria bacterium]|nr:oxidoreductase [Bacteroidota bacterium]HRI83929.1 Gfo/Idh/MocA family oxidoreductase [Ignavibacteria bacterium]HRJ98512.1 Gfo/Idh/MocA family oxidoreductase [Ignavibacteria bacterium]
MKIGIIGFGYWGTNLVRNFANLNGAELIKVSDHREERRQFLGKLCPSAVFCTDPVSITDDKELDAVVIATPVFTHYEFAKRSLENGKHVMVEKPMTSDLKQAEELINISEKTGKVLMVDHTYLYTGAVRKMKELIDQDQIGNIKYFDSTRINLGLFQPDVNVLWDLATHDISILNFLIDEKPVSVQATGVSHTANGIENIAYLTVKYDSGFIAHFNCSWSSPVKIRMMLIGGDKRMIVFNDLEPTEKVKVYDTGYEHKTDEDKTRILVDYRAGDIYIPKIENKEALAMMAMDFKNAIEKGSSPLSDKYSGLEVLKILEASQKSIKNKGAEIKI